MTFKDDGKGFDTERSKGGLSLISMTERAQLIGRTISIDSKPGAGTTIKLSVALLQEWQLTESPDDLPLEAMTRRCRATTERFWWFC